jgi:hypothetical protein
MVAGEQRENSLDTATRYSPALAAKTSVNNRCCTAERRPDGAAICSLLFVDLLPASDVLLPEFLLPDALLPDDLLPVDLLSPLRKDFDAMAEEGGLRRWMICFGCSAQAMTKLYR